MNKSKNYETYFESFCWDIFKITLSNDRSKYTKFVFVIEILLFYYCHFVIQPNTNYEINFAKEIKKMVGINFNMLNLVHVCGCTKIQSFMQSLALMWSPNLSLHSAMLSTPDVGKS